MSGYQYVVVVHDPLYGMFLEKYDIDLKHHIEKIVIGIILISTFPVFLKMIKKTPKESK